MKYLKTNNYRRKKNWSKNNLDMKNKNNIDKKLI